jgi:hypothetical protein
MARPGKLVKERALWGLDFATGCFGDGDCCPTLVTYGADGKPLGLVNLLTTGQSQEAVQVTIDVGRMTAVSDRKVHSYVLWWDSFLTLDGERTDAVICKVGVRGKDTAFLFAQRYRVMGEELVKIGDPTLLASVEQKWNAVRPATDRQSPKKGRGRKKPGSG